MPFRILGFKERAFAIHAEESPWRLPLALIPERSSWLSPGRQQREFPREEDKTLEKQMCAVHSSTFSGSLNENTFSPPPPPPHPPRLRCLNTWSPVGGTGWVGLTGGSVSLGTN